MLDRSTIEWILRARSARYFEHKKLTCKTYMDEQQKDPVSSGVLTEEKDTSTQAAAPQVMETPPESQGNAYGEPKKTKKGVVLIAGTVVVLALVAGGYFFFGGHNDEIEDVNSQDTGAVADDMVVARVNGEELFGKELNYQMLQIAQVVGIPDLGAVDAATRDTIRSQALDAIVNTEILVQTAEGAGVEVGDGEVNSEYASIVESIGGKEVADERLAILGITEEEFKENLASDLLIRKYVENQGGLETVAVTDEEIKSFYDEATDGATENVPPLEDVRFQIEEQLTFQKEQQVLSTLLDSLRLGADVELYLE